MSNENKILIGIGVVTLILVGIAVFSLGGSSANNEDDTKKTKQDANTLVRSDSHSIGPKDAKVTVVEFGDFQCPACGNAYPVVKQIEGAYKDKIRFVFRNYPLPMHKNAKVAAQSAEAAGAQGKFFEMHDKLFDNQKAWSESNNALDEYFVKYAAELKLDVEKFKSEVKSNKYESKIQNDINDGNTVGVNSTPTFYINGIEQVGGLPLDEFKAKIDENLNPSK